MNKQKYLAELSGLLSFLSEENRALALERLNQIFDEAGEAGEPELIARLGTPLSLAISLNRDGIETALSVQNPASDSDATEESTEEELDELECLEGISEAESTDEAEGDEAETEGETAEPAGDTAEAEVEESTEPEKGESSEESAEEAEALDASEAVDVEVTEPSAVEETETEELVTEPVEVEEAAEEVSEADAEIDEGEEPAAEIVEDEEAAEAEAEVTEPVEGELEIVEADEAETAEETADEVAQSEESAESASESETEELIKAAQNPPKFGHIEAFPELSALLDNGEDDDDLPDAPKFSIIGTILFVILAIIPGIPLFVLSVLLVPAMFSVGVGAGVFAAYGLGAGLASLSYIPDAMLIFGITLLLIGACILLSLLALRITILLVSAWRNGTKALFRKMVRKERAL